MKNYTMLLVNRKQPLHSEDATLLWSFP